LKSIFTFHISLLFFITLLFSACSTKEVYVPKKLDKTWTKYESTKHKIIDTASNVALLDDQTVLSRDGVVAVDINKTHRLISKSDGWIISASIDGNLSLIATKDVSLVKKFDLKKTVAGASVSKNTLAVLFADNELALYDLNTKEILFKEQGGKSIANNSMIENPLFMQGLVLFPTLDGKVIFVNEKLKKRLRTVIVSSENDFNNIISLNLLQNKIIAASSYKLLAIAQKEVRAKYEIRNIVYSNDTIYVTTKQGEVISLNTNLEIQSKIKFPFAHFYGMLLVGDKLYILEKGGYLIVVDKNSFDYKVHQLFLKNTTSNSKAYNDFVDSNHFGHQMESVDIQESYIFPLKDSFYVDNVKILTE